MNEMEAIEKLKSAGFHAQTRDWSLGHSIFVGLGPFHREAVAGWRHSRYIYRMESTWCVIDCVQKVDSFLSLEEAVEHVMAALKDEERAAS